VYLPWNRRLLSKRNERHREQATRNAANERPPIHYRITSSTIGSPTITKPPAEVSRPPAGDCFRDIFTSLPNVSSWPIGEVHDRPFIQCTTGSSAASAEEVKREAN
jgi:hypothetical protein